MIEIKETHVLKTNKCTQEKIIKLAHVHDLL
jgi:hypothetical protein